MTAVTEFEVTDDGDAHARDDVSTQVTACPLVSAELIKLLLLVPALVPFTFHWNEGLVPPLVSTAVNVSAVPLQ
jgi:hypothetical protein